VWRGRSKYFSLKKRKNSLIFPAINAKIIICTGIDYSSAASRLSEKGGSASEIGARGAVFAARSRVFLTV
jgi:hypothetical protein